MVGEEFMTKGSPSEKVKWSNFVQRDDMQECTGSDLSTIGHLRPH